MDKVTVVKKEIKKYEWEEKIKSCWSSGLPVTTCCSRNGINVKTYYYHLRKLRERICEQIAVPVSITQSQQSAAIVIHGGAFFIVSLLRVLDNMDRKDKIQIELKCMS